LTYSPHLGGDAAHGVDELALDQLLERLRLHGALAQRLGGGRDGGDLGLDPHVELGHRVHPHAVPGDQRLVAAPRDLQPQGVHVHRDHRVHDRQHEGAAVQHDALTAEAGAHERALLRGAQVQPVEEPHDDRDHDRDSDQGEEECSELRTAHARSLRWAINVEWP